MHTSNISSILFSICIHFISGFDSGLYTRATECQQCISVISFYAMEVVLNCYRHFWIKLFNISFSVLFSFLQLSTTTSILHSDFPSIFLKEKLSSKEVVKTQKGLHVTFCHLICHINFFFNKIKASDYPVSVYTVNTIMEIILTR